MSLIKAFMTRQRFSHPYTNIHKSTLASHAKSLYNACAVIFVATILLFMLSSL